MDKELFKEMSPSERIEHLRSNADGVEHRIYFEELSEEQLIQKRSTFAQKSIQIAKIEDRKKEAVDKFKIELKPLQEENKTLLTEIKTGNVEKEGDVYKMIDYDMATVGYYSEAGNLIEQRPATVQERSERKLFAQRKAS